MEADRIADEVTSPRSGDRTGATSYSLATLTQPSHAVQRKCACSGGTRCPECEIEGVEAAKGIHRKISPGVAQGSVGSFASKSAVLALGSGRALDSPIRKSMETRFGRDFSLVAFTPSKPPGRRIRLTRVHSPSATTLLLRGANMHPTRRRDCAYSFTNSSTSFSSAERKSVLDRAPAGQYATAGISLGTDNVKTLAKGNFWVIKKSPILLNCERTPDFQRTPKSVMRYFLN